MLVLQIAAGIILAVIVLRFFGVILLAASAFFALLCALALGAAIVAAAHSHFDSVYPALGIGGAILAFVAFCIWTHDPRWHSRDPASIASEGNFKSRDENPR